MANRVPITVRLEAFEGPLDLLLYLIQSHEMDISKISISKITDQYLAYVRLMQELNFDVASEFLVMAATLLLWKSKALLPKDEELLAGAMDQDEVMSQEDLIRQLLEHQRFRAAGDDLAQLPKLHEDVFVRSNRKPPVERVWREMSVTDLALSFQDMLTRARKRTQVLKKETVSIADKILDFKDRLKVGKITALDELLSLERTRPEVVVTFLASLELSRLKKMRLHQQQTYEPIYVELIQSLTGFDTQLATGFDSEQPAPPPETQAESGTAANLGEPNASADLLNAFENEDRAGGVAQTADSKTADAGAEGSAGTRTPSRDGVIQPDAPTLGSPNLG